MIPDRKQIEEAVEICKEKNWGKVELNVTDEQFKEYLRTFLSLAQLFLEVEKGMPVKLEHQGNKNNSRFNKRVDGFNEAIDLCTAHWAGKVEGLEDILICKFRPIYSKFGHQMTDGVCQLCGVNLSQAIRQHLLGGGE